MLAPGHSPSPDSAGADCDAVTADFALPPPYLRVFWPLYLFFRPRTYFHYFVVSHSPALTAFFC